jgi:hypothetical protein
MRGQSPRSRPRRLQIMIMGGPPPFTDPIAPVCATIICRTADDCQPAQGSFRNTGPGERPDPSSGRLGRLVTRNWNLQLLAAPSAQAGLCQRSWFRALVA